MSCQCLPSMHWTNNQCIPIGNQCPTGTYFNGQTCMPTSACGNGQIWDQTLSQCICSSSSFWNGQYCVTCDGGQIYEGSGCFCPRGLFWDGLKCSPINVHYCSSIGNSQWINGKCLCKTGFTAEGKTCMCKGLVSNGICDQCYMKPNSEWKYGLCQCISGHY